MDLPILYEDADVLAVNKPSGVLTTDLQYGAGYAHRLDRDTSGVLVFGKTPEALEFLKKAFEKRDVKKTYLALVYGVLKEKKGVIDFDIGRSRKDFRLRSAQPKARGKLRAAVTRYEVLGDDSSTSLGAGGTHSLLKMMPETGRTHQIRVHLKAIHHPIVGDPLYAPNPPRRDGRVEAGHPDSLNVGRLALHASSIDIPLPLGGRKTITAPTPDDLQVAFAKFARE